jgi:hypothetical protein
MIAFWCGVLVGFAATAVAVVLASSGSGLLTRATNIITKTRFDEVDVPWDDALIGCCGCGLMHRMSFRTNPRGWLTLTARRDDAATAAVRRERTFPCQPTRAGNGETLQRQAGIFVDGSGARASDRVAGEGARACVAPAAEQRVSL